MTVLSVPYLATQIPRPLFPSPGALPRKARSALEVMSSIVEQYGYEEARGIIRISLPNSMGTRTVVVIDREKYKQFLKIQSSGFAACCLTTMFGAGVEKLQMAIRDCKLFFIDGLAKAIVSKHAKGDAIGKVSQLIIRHMALYEMVQTLERVSVENMWVQIELASVMAAGSASGVVSVVDSALMPDASTSTRTKGDMSASLEAFTGIDEVKEEEKKEAGDEEAKVLSLTEKMRPATFSTAMREKLEGESRSSADLELSLQDK